MVAIGAVDGAENWISAARHQKSFLDLLSRNGHSVAGLVAGSARPTVGAHTLEKRASFIDATTNGAVRFGGTAGFLKSVPLGMKLSGCLLIAPMATSIAAAKRIPIMTVRLYWYRTVSQGLLTDGSNG